MSHWTNARARSSTATTRQGGRASWTLALPFLVGLAPILYLWSANAAVVDVRDTLPLTAIVVGATAAVLATLVLVTRARHRAAMTVALLWVPMLSFGYQRDFFATLFPNAPETSTVIANSIVLVTLLALVWIFDVRRLAAYATLAIAIFCLSTVPGLAAGISFGAGPVRSAAQGSGGPDIYFIVLDGYGRSDVLERLYGHDNQPFLDELAERGFYVAEDSYSNYAMTYLSLAATLNMEYLGDDLPRDYEGVDRVIEDAAVIHALQEQGYKYVHFESEWWATADAPLADITFGRGRFESEFERVFFDTTLLGTVLPPRPRHEAIINTFDDVAEVPAIREPTFSFAHMLVPHPPFMFDANGAVIPYADDLAAEFTKDPYVAQLEYVNAEVLRLVNAITAESDDQPVVVIQGDHGPAAFLTDSATPEDIYWERHGILNAMLVPDSVRQALYPSVSPVNTFRLLLNDLFDADLQPLPDRAYYSWYMNGNHAAVEGDHLQVQDITEQLP